MSAGRQVTGCRMSPAVMRTVGLITRPEISGGADSRPIIEEAQARLSGWYIGGGVEWKVSPGWTAGHRISALRFRRLDTIAHSHLAGGVPGACTVRRHDRHRHGPRDLAVGPARAGAAEVGRRRQTESEGRSQAAAPFISDQCVTWIPIKLLSLAPQTWRSVRGLRIIQEPE